MRFWAEATKPMDKVGRIGMYYPRWLFSMCSFCMKSAVMVIRNMILCATEVVRGYLGCIFMMGIFLSLGFFRILNKFHPSLA